MFFLNSRISVSDNGSCDYKTLDKYSEDMLSPNSTKNHITIIHINIVSLQKNFDAFTNFLNRFPRTVSVICLSETRLNDRKINYSSLPGYRLFYNNSVTKAGGSAIYVSDCLNCHQLSQSKIKCDGCEDVWVNVKLNNSETLVVGSVYRHPNNVIKNFEDAFISVIKSFKSNQNYIVLGDFNINYDEVTTQQSISDYANHINNVGCEQLIDKPTRICQTTGSIIDHIYVNSILKDHVQPIIFYEDISDHLPICATIKCKPIEKAANRPYRRKISQENIALFLEDLRTSLNKPKMRSNKNLDDLVTLMNELTNAYFPKRMLSRRQFKTSKNPWITPGILTSIKHKNRLYAKYVKNKSPIAHTDYKKYRNKLTHVKEAAKKIYYQKLFLGPGNPSNTWKNINQLLRKNKPKSTVPSLVKVGDKTITDPTEICNKLNEHFVTIGEKLGSKSIFQNDQNYRKYLGKRHVSSVILQPTHAYEILEIITGLDINKSPGYIDIPVILIKESKFLISHYLATSFNECIETGTYPDILKIAKVVPLHKGGYQMDLGNYRPISILSPFNKIFEIILHKRPVDFWDKYKLFTNLQFGFRKKFSTDLAITYLYETILQQMDCGKSVCGAFLDFAKAFDCVNHQILMNKLEHYGVRGNVHSLLHSYLTSRFQYTVQNDLIFSNQLPITTGVPQGSVLGPFLFLVYINDLPNACDTKIILYADDSVLLCADNDIDKLKLKTETEFHNIETWTNLNKISINYNKTNSVLFSRSKSTAVNNFVIKTSDRPLTNKSVIKYLGVLFDNKLNWEQHIQYVLAKLCIARGVLMKLRHYAPVAVPLMYILVLFILIWARGTGCKL